jgi:hypothetical protein
MPNARATWWEDDGSGSFVSYSDFFVPLPVTGGSLRAYLSVSQAGHQPAQSGILTGP